MTSFHYSGRNRPQYNTENHNIAILKDHVYAIDVVILNSLIESRLEDVVQWMNSHLGDGVSVASN